MILIAHYNSGKVHISDEKGEELYWFDAENIIEAKNRVLNDLKMRNFIMDKLNTHKISIVWREEKEIPVITKKENMQIPETDTQKLICELDQIDKRIFVEEQNYRKLMIALIKKALSPLFENNLIISEPKKRGRKKKVPAITEQEPLK